MSQYESQFEERLYNERREKLAKIAELVRAGNPDVLEAEARYPNSFAFTYTVPELRAIGDPKSGEELEAGRIEAAIAGRIMAIRVQGKAGFAQIQQGGQRLQIYVRKDDVGEDVFAIYKLLDLGDHVGVRGYLMRTRTGELTLHAASVDGLPAISFLTKAMLALPDKYHGLEDVELRYRQRYVDLIVNSTAVKADGVAQAAVASSGETAGLSTSVEMTELGGGGRETDPSAALRDDKPGGGDGPEDAPLNVREVFVKRAAVLRAIRKFFDERGYLEVETPMLHTVAGGAAARPFTTHHNALDIDLSLRIAPELYLKRLVVGGLDRVYEINRNFRNEGVSTRHNPEFTMLEFYQAYANYHDLMELTEELISSVAMEVNGTTVTRLPMRGLADSDFSVEIDLGKWKRLSMRDAIVQFWPGDMKNKPSFETFNTPVSLKTFAQAAERELTDELIDSDEQIRHLNGVDLHDLRHYINPLETTDRPGRAIAELFEFLAEPHLIQPTIIYDFPLAVSPLSKVKPDEPDWVERFEFYIGGFEVGNAFSELNDADDQRRRFLAQLEAKEAGDEEASDMDEDYVRALGYGLPPTAGEGIGIDRLTMLLTGSRSIRDVILFPLMRPLLRPAEDDGPGESAE